MRIVLKSAEKDFVLSHTFGILPLMLWMIWLSSFDPKAKIPLWSSEICLLPWDPNFESLDSYGLFMESENHFQRQTKGKRYEISKAMFVCKVLVKCLLCIRLIREGSRRTPVMWWRWIKQQLKEKGSVRRVLVKLFTPRKSGANATLKLGASSESRNTES